MTTALLTCLFATSLLAPASFMLQDEPVSFAPARGADWTFPALTPAAHERVVLEFQARVQFDRPAGSMYFLDLTLNGQPVDCAIDRLRTRLLNKPPQVGHGANVLAWYQPLSGWRICYGPDFDESKQPGYGPDAYRFVLDVTDLVKPDAENVVHIGRRPVLNANPLWIQHVSAQVEPGEPVATAPGARPKLTPPWQVTVGDDGGLRLQAGDQSFPFVTRISHPGGGWYSLGEGLGEPDQPVAWSKLSPTGDVLQREGDGFTVSRKVSGAGSPTDGVVIEDTFTNTSDHDLGWFLSFQVGIGDQPLPTVYLGGASNPGVNQGYFPYNPTCFAPFDGGSVGLVAEDDVLRSQATYHYETDPPRLEIRTERFCLAPGASYTTRVKLHLLATDDYFDLVNAIRRDWQVKVTIPGPVVWGFVPDQVLKLTDDELKAVIDRQQLWAISSGGGWVDYTRKDPDPRQIGFGAGVLDPWFDHWRGLLKQAADKIHRVSPSTKVLYYVHCFFNDPDPDPEQFKDSWITRNNSVRFAVNWSGKFTNSGGVYPTLTNSFGPAFSKMIDTLLQDWGADGIYQDETTHPSGMIDPLTFDRWDGHTAILDPATFAIKQKCGNLYLLTQDYKLKLYADLQQRGIPILGNGQPVGLKFNQERFPRFTETHGSLDRVKECQLYTPISYGYPNLPMPEIRKRLAQGVLHYRVGFNDASDVLAHFYPITVTDLHSGWVRGEERIVTMHTGEYGWSTKTAAKLYRYDAKGLALPELDLPAATAFQVDVPDGGVAILERAGT